jgi:glucose-6-phosphate 1-dehydrogenase
MTGLRTGSSITVSEIPGAPLVEELTPEPCVLVIFGALGDLTRTKIIPALYNLIVDAALPKPFAVIGLGRHETSPEAFRVKLRTSTEEFSRRKPLDEGAWNALAESLDFIEGTFEDASVYAALKAKLGEVDKARGTKGNHIFYLAAAAEFFPVIINQLKEAGLIHASASSSSAPFCRVIVEKPFGRDLASARALNALVGETLHESQIFRIDHYLGKETVQNILVFRLGNSLFEPLWSRDHIDHVEITAAESIGVGTRGRFYDATGVLRDIVQNHLLQVLALCAMEPPLSFGSDDIRDEKMRVFRALRPITGAGIEADVVRAQYAGYCTEPNVAADSRTPTYVAMKVMIDNWRWQGVPFYLRAGKLLAERKTEVLIHFKTVPLCLFGRAGESCQVMQPSVLALRIQPEEGISFGFVAKVPGNHLSVANVHMNMSYADSFKKPAAEAYERLLLDCMRGDATLFARRDGVEQTWAFATPILEAWAEDARDPLPTYEAGSAGPKEADALLQRDGRHWTRLSSGVPHDAP